MLVRTWRFKDTPVYWSRFPRSGWSTSLLLPDAEPKQADLPPRSPLSAGRKCFVLSEGGGHIVRPLPEAGNMSIQCFWHGESNAGRDAGCLARTNLPLAGFQHGSIICSFVITE